MGEYAGTIAAIASIISAGTGMGLALSSPGVKIPQVPTFQIPQEDMAALNQQIQANTALSDQSRAAAQQAISSYSQGQLSAAYAGQYEQAAANMTAQFKNQMAAQGFTEGSTQYQDGYQKLQLSLANMKSQLLQQQLSAGLQTAGLSDTAINDYFNKWSTMSGVTTGQAGSSLGQSYLGLKGAELTTQQNTGKAAATGGLVTSLFGTPDKPGGAVGSLTNLMKGGTATPNPPSSFTPGIETMEGTMQSDSSLPTITI